ncbi:hypothetical protein [Serratia marcescens]|uniref:hypothetical protein n=1 Tax=Serratia marcescens TaxID=615 RepID=UPI000E3ECDC4|nr:hypothetical protein [Serratia marcescens]RFS87667.1 hypothetical protein CIB53_24130 [Serratia marcescens]
MKSFNDYLNSAEGTAPAVGKDFELYGMSIGKFQAMFLDKMTLVFTRDGESMEVPLLVQLPQFNLPQPIPNPVLNDIKAL